MIWLQIHKCFDPILQVKTLAKKCSQSWKIILFFPENQHILHTYSLGPLANQHINHIKFTKHLRKIMPSLQTAKKILLHICQQQDRLFKCKTFIINYTSIFYIVKSINNDVEFCACRRSHFYHFLCM